MSARLAGFLAGAMVGYVLVRAAWIFLDWPGVAVAVLLLAAATYAAWRRRRWFFVAGLEAGAAVSAGVLAV